MGNVARYAEYSPGTRLEGRDESTSGSDELLPATWILSVKPEALVNTVTSFDDDA